MNQKISAVTPAVLKKLYLDNKGLPGNDPAVKELKSVFSFLSGCFEGKKPNINKVELRRLSWIVKEFLKTYNLNDVKDEFGLAFIKFNDRRFESAFKILEFRNTQIAEIARNVQLIRGNNNEFSVSG